MSTYPRNTVELTRKQASDRDGYSTVATASSGEDGTITVWRSKKRFTKSSQAWTFGSLGSLYHLAFSAIQVLMAVAAIAFVLQNLDIVSDSDTRLS